MAENPCVLPQLVAEILALGQLIPPRNAPGVALGLMHVRPAPFQLRLFTSVKSGALRRAAMSAFAVRRHRSSYLESVVRNSPRTT